MAYVAEYPFRSQNVCKCTHFQNVYLMSTAPSDVVGRVLDAAVGAFIYSFKKSVVSALCHERLTWPIDASRGGVAFHFA